MSGGLQRIIGATEQRDGMDGHIARDEISKKIKKRNKHHPKKGHSYRHSHKTILQVTDKVN